MWTTHTHSHVFFLEIRSNINFSSTNPNLPVTLTCNDLRVCPHEELRTAECDHVNTSMSSQETFELSAAAFVFSLFRHLWLQLKAT